jgi:zinc finger-like protein
MVSCPFYLIMKVLPQARIKFSPEKQSELLYKSLCVMPLKLLEQVLPWFVSKLDDANEQSFLQNMFLIGTSLLQIYYMLYASRSQ